jgi:cation diffusion facilitator family transporter
MSAEGHSTKVVITGLAVNATIAVAKGIAAAISGSGSMLAEAIHTASDCLNQILLLIGLKQATAGASEKHPLGTGRASYFWSFLVALMLFFGGGVFSIGEGVEKILHKEPVHNIGLSIGVLIFSLVLESFALAQCFRELDKKRGKFSRTEYLGITKDAELVVSTGENFAAVVGLTFALGALLLAYYVDPRFDGVGGVLVGLVLVWVAIFLARKIKGLLLGERADPEIEEQVHLAAKEDARIKSVLRLITVQQGPGEVLVAAKLRFDDTLNAKEVTEAINDFEARVRKREPEVKWQFIEPDFEA